MSKIPTREEALALLKEYNKEDWHIRHALSVEAVMHYFAREIDPENVEKWGVVGLLHDIDFELYPEQHCVKAKEILREHGVADEIIHAVASHGWGLTAVDDQPEHQMEKVLFAVDELTGLVAASCAVRPSKSVLDLEVSSVMKKFKQPSFAAGISRKVIEDGAAMLGVSLDSLIQQTILGMREAADAIGLKGML
jgi:putative nucleotidyltransferase with HDIG domain